MLNIKTILSLANLSPAKFIRVAFVIVLPFLYFGRESAVNSIIKGKDDQIKNLEIALALSKREKDEISRQKDAEKDYVISDLKRDIRMKDSMYIENLNYINAQVRQNNKVLKTLDK